MRYDIWSSHRKHLEKYPFAASKVKHLSATGYSQLIEQSRQLVLLAKHQLAVFRAV
jgi:hypothetical protein